jgi:hypothetical protein
VEAGVVVEVERGRSTSFANGMVERDSDRRVLRMVAKYLEDGVSVVRELRGSMRISQEDGLDHRIKAPGPFRFRSNRFVHVGMFLLDDEEITSKVLGIIIKVEVGIEGSIDARKNNKGALDDLLPG